ncbi:hypothetical protein CPB85DRAFT_1559507 [Mucidula mucida]|nr:hypothetical protein CPB85DRAFT_1559507 [Mucidula mucida]
MEAERGYKLRDESKWDSPLAPSVLPEKDDQSWNDVETASFLALPKTRPRTKSTRTSRKPISRAQTTKTNTTMSSYSQVDEDEGTDDDMEFLNDYETDDENEVEGARTRRRHPHARQNSDYAATVQREKSNASSSTWGWAALSSNLGREKSMDAKSVGEKSLGGFRIMQESPLPTPSTNKVFGWAKEENQDDMYTEIPTRGRRSRSPSKARSSPVKRSGAVSKSAERKKAVGTSKNPFKHGDTYPFGQSPRQITSPKLEGKLCFTPRIGQEPTQLHSMLSLDDVEPLKL